LPAKDLENYGQLAKIAGFSLHAEVFADTHQADKMIAFSSYDGITNTEGRLIRTIERPTLEQWVAQCPHRRRWRHS